MTSREHQAREVAMLPDCLETLLTRCPRHLRQMGYLRELLNIRQRYHRWHAAWEPHCEQSRAVLRSAMARCSSHRKAVIFGSGWLHDVPLDDLAQTFQQVVLVDVLHPFSTRWRLPGQSNVQLLAADVTGTIEGVWQASRRKGAPLPRAVPDLFIGDTQVDLIASMNLLSQLPCLPEEYLTRVASHPPEAIRAYAHDVVQAHLDYLVRLPGVVALVADVESHLVSVVGRLVERISTLYGAKMPWEGVRWTWPLVPRRPAPPHHGQHLVVVGIEDVKTARAAEHVLSGKDG
jgi:hypothetical protein